MRVCTDWLSTNKRTNKLRQEDRKVDALRIVEDTYQAGQCLAIVRACVRACGLLSGDLPLFIGPVFLGRGQGARAGARVGTWNWLRWRRRVHPSARRAEPRVSFPVWCDELPVFFDGVKRVICTQAGTRFLFSSAFCFSWSLQDFFFFFFPGVFVAADGRESHPMQCATET